MAAVFAVPSVASATVTETHVTSPGVDTVFDSSYLFGSPGGADPSSSPMTVSGTAPGATDGDELTLICTVEYFGVTETVELTDGRRPVRVEDGRFSTTAAYQPPYTCRVRAVPADLDLGTGISDELTPELKAAFTGPRILGGGFVTLPASFGSGPGDDDSAETYVAFRGQRRGLGLYAGSGVPFYSALGIGSGLGLSFYNEDTSYRAMFAGAGALAPFGIGTATRATARAASDVDLADAPLVVDGRPATPWSNAGDEHSRVVSRSTNPVTGDLTFVEVAPVGFMDDASGSTLTSAGVRLRRTVTQDHDGRQSTFVDAFESTDGAAHEIEVRYGEGVLGGELATAQGLNEVKAPAFRVPWATGTEYVSASEGDPIPAAPAGPATIYVRGGQFEYNDRRLRARGRAATRAAADPVNAEGAITFDAPPSDGRFLAPQSFVVRFVRSIPAGGSTSIKHVYSQDGTTDGLGGLVTDATGEAPVTDAPTPGSAPLPTSPAPVAPVSSPFVDPLERFSLAARGLLLKPHLARRVRDGRKSSVVISNMPEGRYTVAIRRYVKNGRTLASGAVTQTTRGTVKVPVDLSRYGKGYFKAKRDRGDAQVKVRVEVSWTPTGQKTLRKKKIRVVQFK